MSTQGTVAIDRMADQIDRLAAVRDRIAALKDEEKALVTQIRAEMGTAQFGTVGGVDIVRADSRENTSIDREAVKTLLGAEKFGTVLKITPYVALRVLRPSAPRVSLTKAAR